MISYEYPIGKSTRPLLHLEDLFDRNAHFLVGQTPEDHHAALATIRNPGGLAQSDTTDPPSPLWRSGVTPLTLSPLIP